MSSRANLSEAKVGKQVQDSTSHPADDVADNSGATSIIAHNGSKTLLPPSSLYYADGLTVNQPLSHIAIGGHIHAAFNATTNGNGFQYNRATLAAWLSDPNPPRTFIDGAQDQYKKKQSFTASRKRTRFSKRRTIGGHKPRR